MVPFVGFGGNPDDTEEGTVGFAVLVGGIPVVDGPQLVTVTVTVAGAPLVAVGFVDELEAEVKVGLT